MSRLVMEVIEMCLCGLVFSWCFQCFFFGDQTWFAGENRFSWKTFPATNLYFDLCPPKAQQFFLFSGNPINPIFPPLSLSHEIHKNIITYNLNHHFPKIFTAFSHVSDLDVLQFSAGFVAGFRMWSRTPLPSRPVPCWERLESLEIHGHL